VYLFVIGFILQNFDIPSGSMEKTLLIGDHLIVDHITLAPPTKWAPFVHYRPVRRGDIIVFLKPHSEDPDMILVKRAIGIPGDRIHLRQGVVYLNGVAQTEPYAQQPTEGDMISYRDDFPGDIAGLRQWANSDLSTRGMCQDKACSEQAMIDERALAWSDELKGLMKGEDLVVPPGKVFAMGDNRADSLDSRFWGLVPDGNILGRPLFVYWSYKATESQAENGNLGDKIEYMLHEASHFFSGTRWGRTLHVTR
jgi:signal peptidase I